MPHHADFQHWIFDMDGTLTRSVHDFDRIRRELDIPVQEPILEYIARLEPAVAHARHERLLELEWEYAHQAKTQPGADTVLALLRERGCALGVLTRNQTAIAHHTLERAGLAAFFEPRDVIGAERAAPKPAPEGVLRLMTGWGASADHTVIMGDYLYDLLAGRNAGVHTIYFDPNEESRWTEHADLHVTNYRELAKLIKCG